jgi:hypothetical protein
MRRFVSNRSWTLIPALLLSLALATVSARPAVAAFIAYDGDGSIEGGGTPSPQMGDPDLPGTSIKSGAGRSAAGKLSASRTGVRTAGDSRATEIAVMWRVQVALQGVWKIYFRY